MATQEIKFQWDDFQEKVVRRIATSQRGALPVLAEQGRGIIRLVMRVTPPGNKNVDGMSAAARRHGMMTIQHDLLGGGSRNKHQRTGGAFAPMPRSIIQQAADVHGGSIKRLWTTKDGRVYGVEHDFFLPNASRSDLRAHHRKYFRNGRFTRAGGATRDIGRWKFIDRLVIPEDVFRAYLKEQQAKVGYLLSGWRVAARKLGLNIPQWILNADGPSQALIEVRPDRLRILATNEVAYASNTGLNRRIQWAIDQQAAKMQRQWEEWSRRLFR